MMLQTQAIVRSILPNQVFAIGGAASHFLSLAKAFALDQ
jgi:hypothetical protein